MKAQLALRMKYRLAAVRKRHYVPHSSGARARAKFQFIAHFTITENPPRALQLRGILTTFMRALYWAC